jgi:hypothetical protein
MRKQRSKQQGQPIIFSVLGSHKDGYEARALGHSIFTQAATLSELKKNVRDAVLCHFGEVKRGTSIRLIRARPDRILGSAKGEFTVPDDFNDPLPEIEDLFFGK